MIINKLGEEGYKITNEVVEDTLEDMTLFKNKLKKMTTG
jgi:hypothetical protein